MRTSILTVAALAACALVSGCMTSGLGDRSLGRGLDDAAAASQVRVRLAGADSQAFGDVDVVVVNGVMLLTGAAPTQGHKDAAEVIARGVGGVSTLYNEIIVGAGGNLTTDAEDELLAARIRARLATSSSSARSYNVEIETYRGAVYLLGTAHNETELRRAAEIASLVPGVTRVVSLMSVHDSRPAYARNAPPTPDYRGDGQAQSADATHY